MSFPISWQHGRTGAVSRARAKHRRGKPLPMLTPAERVLYRVDSATGTCVATNHALLLRMGAEVWRRIAWSDIAAIEQSPGADHLALRLWPHGFDAHPRLEVVADVRLAALARERITAHRLLSVPIDLDGTSGTVIALRDGDGVRWHVALDKPRDDPRTRAAIAEAIAEIRGIAGI